MTATYTPRPPIWCAGCGHFGVQAALTAALRDAGVPAHQVLILAGIGCSGTIQNNLGTYGYHALHGRVLPTATGVSLADPALTVIAAGGDGDGYAIGAGHLVHTFRRNPSFTYLLMNNSTYGLTKGQDSPTAALVHPADRRQVLDGVLLGLGITTTTFLARGYSGRPAQLRRLVTAAIEHARARRGFGFVEILSPCVTYQDTYPVWDAAVHDLESEPGYDPHDRSAAFGACLRVMESGGIPTGLIYRSDAAGAAAPQAPARAELDGQTGVYAAIMSGYRV
jgi:2-oxoglutarate ferredoxin oxidoreductase subunit beta